MATATSTDYRAHISRAIERAASIAGLSEPELWERCCKLVGHDPEGDEDLDQGLELLAAAEVAGTPVGILLDESATIEEVRDLTRRVRDLERMERLEEAGAKLVEMWSDPAQVARHLADLLAEPK